MKLPSLQSLWDETLAVFRRFPLQVLVTIAAVFVFILKIDTPSLSYLNKLLGCLNFALTLLLAADLFAETHSWNAVKQWSLRVAVLLVCGALYFLLNPAIFEADQIRMLLLGFAFHLLVSFSPFIGRGNVQGFWAYNERLFLRLINAGIFSLVLTIGLYIAYASTDALFDLKLSGKMYGYISSFTLVGFLTIFFLSGVPKDFATLNDQPHGYPKWLKIFTQYVLIPLVTVYLMILLAYEGKILLSWELPKGYVSTLILGYAVMGILSLLLIYPIRNKEGNSWMTVFSKLFYVMMIPLVILLLLAVWKRVSVYGITEARYILVLLAVWLTIVTFYNLVSRKQNIRLIPVSLCVLALLAVYGPQSAFSVSKYSQVQRLKRLFGKNDSSARSEKQEIIRYLVRYHGIMAVQDFTTKDLGPLRDHFDKRLAGAEWKYSLREQQIDSVMSILKVPKSPGMYDSGLSASADQAIIIKGYDYYLPYTDYERNEYVVGGAVVSIYSHERKGLELKLDTEVVTIDVSRHAAKIYAAIKAGKLELQENSPYVYHLPDSLVEIPIETKQFIGVFHINKITVADNEGSVIRSLEGALLLRLKTTK